MVIKVGGRLLVVSQSVTNGESADNGQQTRQRHKQTLT